MFNKAFLLGRVGKEVKLAYTKDECPVASFDMATNEYYKDKNGERVTATTWHKIVAYRNLAEICTDLLNKGSLIFIEGRINKENGQTKTATTTPRRTLSHQEFRFWILRIRLTKILNPKRLLLPITISHYSLTN